MSRALLHISDGLRRVVDPDTVYYIEAVRGDTRLHRRRGKPLRDIRHLGSLQKSWKNHGFVRAHRNHCVNPDRILEIRRRRGSEYWEIKLAPPVNKVLPVGRTYLKDLRAAFGER